MRMRYADGHTRAPRDQSEVLTDIRIGHSESEVVAIDDEAYEAALADVDREAGTYMPLDEQHRWLARLNRAWCNTEESEG